jgi:hypothetical protein
LYNRDKNTEEAEDIYEIDEEDYEYEENEVTEINTND